MAHVDLLALIRNDQTAADLEGKALVQLLHQIHHTVEIGKGLIQLNGGKLRVMLGVHALVAEDATHLVHTVHAAHDEPLQVQLGLDAQHHVHVQGVVMGVEGTGGSADLKGGQDGGVHFQEALLVQIGADLLQDLAALYKGVLHLRIGDQVHIALAIAGLGIGQTMELFGQGAQAFCQQGDLLGADAELTGLGAEHLAFDADDVAQVQFFKGCVGLIAQLVPADVELDIALVVPQMGKACLAHDALGHHATCQRHLFAAVGLIGQILEFLLQVGGIGVLRELGQGKGIVARSLQVSKLLAAHLHLLAFGQSLCGISLLFFHGYSLVSGRYQLDAWVMDSTVYSTV